MRFLPALAALFLLTPLAASADVNKCSKELSKNSAKVATDVQKELAKCVDGWLKDEDKVLINALKGNYSFDGVTGESSGLLKAAAKCEKSLLKILQWGVDVGTTNGVQEKTKTGKMYQKLAGAVGVSFGSKPKCGIDPVTKTQTAAQLDLEMSQLGHFPPSADLAWRAGEGMAGIDVRLMVMGGVADAWNTQGRVNRDTYRAIQAAGNDRCAVSGIQCDDTTECNPADPLDICSPSQCPDCIKFARAVDVSPAPGGTFCSDNSPTPWIPCIDELSCGGTPGVTDFCDTAPSQGAIAGPCHMAACQGGDPLTSATVIELEGVLSLPPVFIYACDNSPNCTFASPVIVNLANDHPAYLCDIQEILPNAVGMVGGAGRGITAVVTLNLAPVCVDSTGYTGYIDKWATYPQFDVVSCIDVDKNTDWGSGAGAADGCAASTRCRDEVVEYPPGTVTHTGKICQDLVPTAAGTNHGLIRNDQILTTGAGLPSPTANPCDPATLIAAGEPSPLTLTTHAASGNLWDAGPLTTGAPLGGLIIEPGNFWFANLTSGTPFDANALAGGALDGALVSSFGSIATNPAASIGAQLTKVVLDCNP
jgi:hypothetical protein